MEQKRLGSSGSADGGFLTGITSPSQLSKDLCAKACAKVVATLPEPVRKLYTTPDPVTANAPSPLTPSSAAQDQVVDTDSPEIPHEKPHVRFPENVEPQRSTVPSFPLLVDARCTRGNPEEIPNGNFERSHTECMILRGMNLEGAWPDSGSGGGWESPAHPPWPESICGGGATCLPPNLARKRPPPATHEPMGEVLLLGSGLRAPAFTRCESSKPAPVKSRVEVGTKKTDPKEKMEHGKSAHVPINKNAASTASPGAVSALAILQPMKIADGRDSLGKPGLQATLKSGRKGDRDDDANRGRPSSKSSPKTIDPKSTAIPRDSSPPKTIDPKSTTVSHESSPKAKSLHDVKECAVPRETDILDEVQERLQESTMRPVVEKHDIALQTDASPRGAPGPYFAGISAENQRILLLQRCNPRHVNLSSWLPLPKPKTPTPTEMHYLSHVKSRFPGTIDKNCCLEAPPIPRSRPLVTPRRTDS